MTQKIKCVYFSGLLHDVNIIAEQTTSPKVTIPTVTIPQPFPVRPSINKQIIPGEVSRVISVQPIQIVQGPTFPVSHISAQTIPKTSIADPQKKLVKQEFINFKELYQDTIHEYFKRNKCNFYPPFNSPGLNKLINIVAEGKAAVKRGELVCNKLSRLLSMYDVTAYRRNLQLTKRIITPSDPIKLYLSCEDSYYYIKEAHFFRTNHGGLEKIMNILRTNTGYHISEMAVKLFLSLCNICVMHGRCGRGTEEIVNRNEKWQIAICFVSRPDQSFGYVLFVVDKATDFVHLRPLTSCDKTTVAIELLKLFSDFGKPLVIESSTQTFFQEAVLYIEKLCPDYETTVNYTKIDLSELTFRVGRYLDEWQDTTKSNNWAFGIHEVQWRLNNSPDFKMKTNFEKMFGVSSSYRLATNENNPDLTDNSESSIIAYEYFDIGLLEGDDLDLALSEIETLPLNEKEISSLDDLEDIIVGNVIIKHNQKIQVPKHLTGLANAPKRKSPDTRVATVYAPAGPIEIAYLNSKSHDSRYRVQIGGQVQNVNNTIPAAEKPTSINPQESVSHQQQEIPNNDEIDIQRHQAKKPKTELVKNLENDLNKTLRNFIRTSFIPKAIINNNQDLADTRVTNSTKNSIEKLNLRHPSTSQTHSSPWYRIVDSEESNYNDDVLNDSNSGKITLMSVEIEED